MEYAKSPIGVTPYRYWYLKVAGERIAEIRNACVRYAKANKEIPKEWLAEYDYLMEQCRLANEE